MRDALARTGPRGRDLAYPGDEERRAAEGDAVPGSGNHPRSTQTGTGRACRAAEIGRKGAAKEAAEIERERADTAAKAATILKAATEARADHPCLVRWQSRSSTLSFIRRCPRSTSWRKASGPQSGRSWRKHYPLRPGQRIKPATFRDDFGKSARVRPWAVTVAGDNLDGRRQASIRRSISGVFRAGRSHLEWARC